MFTAIQFRQIEILNQAIDNLSYFYPELKTNSLRQGIYCTLEVPDTGNDQNDYEAVKEQIERYVYRTVDYTK